VSSGLYVAAAGAVAQATALDATANNIANASTPGYRGEIVTFQEAMGKAKSADVTLVDNGTHGADAQPGALSATDNPLDCALEGDGMFAVDTAQGTRYTRAGNFQLDSQNRLVTADGAPLRGDDGNPITLPANASNVSIAADGTVSADGAAVGKLALARFSPSQLTRQGGTLYAASGKPAAGPAPVVRSGMLESSNVNVIHGVVDLVKVQRTYETLMRVIQGYSDIEQHAAQTLGTPK
jgi:flagellar basal-body rod protein FlgF